MHNILYSASAAIEFRLTICLKGTTHVASTALAAHSYPVPTRFPVSILCAEPYPAFRAVADASTSLVPFSIPRSWITLRMSKHTFIVEGGIDHGDGENLQRLALLTCCGMNTHSCRVGSPPRPFVVKSIDGAGQDCRNNQNRDAAEIEQRPDLVYAGGLMHEME